MTVPPGPEEFELVTIIAEPLVKTRLIDDIVGLGARGYSVSSAEGSNTRATAWEGPNIRIETIVGRRLAERILEHIAEHYFEHFAVIAFTHPVRVVRSAKFR